VLEGNIRTLEREIESNREQSVGMQDGLQKSNVKIKDLESEKAAILLKLESTIGILEERTSTTIEKATSRLQDGDRKLQTSLSRTQALENELEMAQIDIRSLQAASIQSATDLQTREVQLEKERERVLGSESQCSALEGTFEAFRITISKKDTLLMNAEVYLREIDTG
jgi:chromosome segregation ATPase